MAAGPEYFAAFEASMEFVVMQQNLGRYFFRIDFSFWNFFERDIAPAAAGKNSLPGDGAQIERFPDRIQLVPPMLIAQDHGSIGMGMGQFRFSGEEDAALQEAFFQHAFSLTFLDKGRVITQQAQPSAQASQHGVDQKFGFAHCFIILLSRRAVGRAFFHPKVLAACVARGQGFGS